jgi:hypothetical protein
MVEKLTAKKGLLQDTCKILQDDAASLMKSQF